MVDIELVKEWLLFAYNDYVSAKHLFEDMHPKQIDIACFHTQQSAEKSLKAFLLFCEIEPPMTHSLKLLQKLCISRDSSFYEIENQCIDLNPYGVASRYPNELETDEILAKAAIEKAKQVYDFCLSKISMD
jgi:HEPN domain-containing protein